MVWWFCHKRYHERYSFGKKKKTKVIFQNKFGYFFLFNHINIFNHINHIFLFNQYLITYEQQLDSSQRRNYNPVRYLPLTIFVESSVTNVWRVSKYVFVRFSFPNLSIFPDYINTCIYIYIYIYVYIYTYIYIVQSSVCAYWTDAMRAMELSSNQCKVSWSHTSLKVLSKNTLLVIRLV